MFLSIFNKYRRECISHFNWKLIPISVLHPKGLVMKLMTENNGGKSAAFQLVLRVKMTTIKFCVCCPSSFALESELKICYTLLNLHRQLDRFPQFLFEWKFSKIFTFVSLHDICQVNVALSKRICNFHQGHFTPQRLWICCEKDEKCQRCNCTRKGLRETCYM